MKCDDPIVSKRKQQYGKETGVHQKVQRNPKQMVLTTLAHESTFGTKYTRKLHGGPCIIYQRGGLFNRLTTHPYGNQKPMRLPDGPLASLGESVLTVSAWPWQSSLRLSGRTLLPSGSVYVTLACLVVRGDICWGQRSGKHRNWRPARRFPAVEGARPCTSSRPLSCKLLGTAQGTLCGCAGVTVPGLVFHQFSCPCYNGSAPLRF